MPSNQASQVLNHVTPDTVVFHVNTVLRPRTISPVSSIVRPSPIRTFLRQDPHLRGYEHPNDKLVHFDFSLGRALLEALRLRKDCDTRAPAKMDVVVLAVPISAVTKSLERSDAPWKISSDYLHETVSLFVYGHAVTVEEDTQVLFAEVDFPISTIPGAGLDFSDVKMYLESIILDEADRCNQYIMHTADDFLDSSAWHLLYLDQISNSHATAGAVVDVIAREEEDHELKG